MNARFVVIAWYQRKPSSAANPSKVTACAIRNEPVAAAAAAATAADATIEDAPSSMIHGSGR